MSGTVETILLYTIGAGLLSIVYGFLTGKNILNSSAGNAKMQDIASAIQIGAKAYLARQYKTIAIVGAVVLVIVSIAFSPLVGLGYLIGAALSGIAGYVGMLVSVEANVRTAEASRKGLAQGLSVAFKSGAVTGMLVAGLALLAIAVYYYILLKSNVEEREIVNALVALGFGASLISIFARLGGGIFTKGADVGADLVGKVEAGIPEDDPRNPAVIADNVGDNVGDCAGMAADLFETYAVTIVATMVLSSIFFVGDLNMMIYPLSIGAACLLTSIVGTFFVKLGKSNNVMNALYKGFVVSAVASLIILWPVTDHVIGFTNEYTVNDKTFNGMDLYYCGVIGLVITGLLIWITEYYTGSKPVEKIAKSGETGPATVMITGLSVGMQSVVLPILVLATIILVSTSLVGLYGVGIAAVGMLATVGITMAIDAYGPVADNAGGIAEMSGMGSETREITDSLDELGNSTAAIGKGFAIGAAALAALAIIAAFVETVAHNRGSFELLLSDPRVLVGMFIGISIPFLISSITMTAVGDAAFDMINEIRRQFREIPGLLEGNAEPDTAKCVDIATSAALKRMLLPGVIAVSAPAVVGFGLGPESLGGMLGGGLIGCVSMALMMANAGGAWDNAKKFIEKGNLGGKGTDTHSAAVVGDTVGDPFKDTSGPSMNILINVMAIVSLVISPLL